MATKMTNKNALTYVLDTFGADLPADVAEKLNGKPKMPVRGDREVAKVIYRDGTLLDTIYNVPVK